MPPKGPKSKRGPSVNQPLNENVKKVKVDTMAPEVFDSNRTFSYALKSVLGDEIEELEKFVKSKHLRVVELEKKCSKYEKDIYEMKSDLQNLTRSYKTLQVSNEMLRANLARYENENDGKSYDLEVKYKDDELIKQQIDKMKHLEKEQNDLKAQLSKELNNKAKLESIMIEKDEKISNLRNQTEILAAKCKEIEKAKGQEKFAHVEKHKSRIEELEFEKKELLRQLEIKNARISEQEKCTSNAMKKLEEEKNDTEFFRNKLCESEITLKQNGEILKQKNLQIERLGESGKEEIAFYREQGKELEANLRNEKNRKELLATELKSSEDKVLNLERELKHMKNMLNTQSINDEEGQQLKVMEELNLMKKKSKVTEDDLLETRNSLNILHEDYNSLKELHAKCHMRIVDPGPLKSSRLDTGALRSELKKIKEDYDILQTQKNIAESDATILKRKLNKLETSKKEVELGLKKELEEYKILKDEEVETFRQNFNPAAKKTIDVLKEEKKSLSCQIEKYKADVENCTESIKEREEIIKRLKLDLFNAEKSALESSISEHKEVVESLQKMPERYRRKTLRKLFNKSEENLSAAVVDDVAKQPDADSHETKDGSVKPVVISSEKSKLFPQSAEPQKENSIEAKDISDPSQKKSPIKAEGTTEPPTKMHTAEDSRTLSVDDLDNTEVIHQRHNLNRKDVSRFSSNFKIPKRTRESGETNLESFPASKVQMIESPSAVQPAAPSFVKNLPQGTLGKSSNPPTASSTRYNLLSSERTIKPLLGRSGLESSKLSNPSKTTNNPFASSTSQHPLMDIVNNFTASLTKQRTKTKETEIKLAVREAVGDLESQGFFSQEKLQKESIEAKFVTYFLRKYKETDPTIEKKKSEIDQTIRLYASRIRDKMNKTI